MKSQCADGRYGGCGRWFSSATAFGEHHDWHTAKPHQPVDGRYKRCLTDEELVAKDLRPNEQGVWSYPPMPQEALTRRRHATQ